MPTSDRVGILVEDLLLPARLKDHGEALQHDQSLDMRPAFLGHS